MNCSMSSWFLSSSTTSESAATGVSARFSVTSDNGSSSEFGVDASAPPKTKTIYLVRHAESEENVNMHGLQEVGMSLVGRKLPSSEDLSRSFQFIAGAAKGDTDSNLSEGGKEQVRGLNQILESDSQKNMSSVINDVDVIGHSPLIRARDTCYGAFGLDKNEPYDNVFELVCLEEVTPWETAIQGRKNTVHKRIVELQNWIEQQKYASTIALVGHSEYFMIMLGLSRAEKFWNCDVWKVQYIYGGKWTGLELKHRLESSKPMGLM